MPTHIKKKKNCFGSWHVSFFPFFSWTKFSYNSGWRKFLQPARWHHLKVDKCPSTCEIHVRNLTHLTPFTFSPPHIFSLYQPPTPSLSSVIPTSLYQSSPPWQPPLSSVPSPPPPSSLSSSPPNHLSLGSVRAARRPRLSGQRKSYWVIKVEWRFGFLLGCGFVWVCWLSLSWGWVWGNWFLFFVV